MQLICYSCETNTDTNLFLSLINIQMYQFSFSYDVVITASEEDIVRAFKKFDARLVFSAEGYCWPDANLDVSTAF